MEICCKLTVLFDQYAFCTWTCICCIVYLILYPSVTGGFAWSLLLSLTNVTVWLTIHHGKWALEIQKKIPYSLTNIHCIQTSCLRYRDAIPNVSTYITIFPIPNHLLTNIASPTNVHQPVVYRPSILLALACAVVRSQLWVCTSYLITTSQFTSQLTVYLSNLSDMSSSQSPPAEQFPVAPSSRGISTWRTQCFAFETYLQPRW